jgi:hypothetical protein
MCSANPQLAISMILDSDAHQPLTSHVSHAKIAGESAFYDGQRCALLTTKSRNTCTRATDFNSSG